MTVISSPMNNTSSSENRLPQNQMRNSSEEYDQAYSEANKLLSKKIKRINSFQSLIFEYRVSSDANTIDNELKKEARDLLSNQVVQLFEYKINPKNINEKATLLDVLAISRLATASTTAFNDISLNLAERISKKNISTSAMLAYGLGTACKLAVDEFSKENIDIYDQLPIWLYNYIDCIHRLSRNNPNSHNITLFFEGLINLIHVIREYGVNEFEAEKIKKCFSHLKGFAKHRDPDIAYLGKRLIGELQTLQLDENLLEDTARDIAAIAGAIALSGVVIVATVGSFGAASIGLLRIPNDVFTVYDRLNSIYERFNYHTGSGKQNYYDNICLILQTIETDIIAFGNQMREYNIETEQNPFVEHMNAFLTKVANEYYIDENADIWLFAKTIWLLRQLNGYETRIQTEFDSIGQRANCPNQTFALYHRLFFLLNYTSNTNKTAEKLIATEMIEIKNVFLNVETSKSIRETALKAIIFLHKYENTQYAALTSDIFAELSIKSEEGMDDIGKQLLAGYLYKNPYKNNVAQNKYQPPTPHQATLIGKRSDLFEEAQVKLLGDRFRKELKSRVVNGLVLNKRHRSELEEMQNIQGSNTVANCAQMGVFKSRTSPLRESLEPGPSPSASYVNHCRLP